MADVDDLLSRLAKGLATANDVERPLPDRLCRAAATLLACDGGAITLAYAYVERVTLCATDDTALIIEEAQDVMGQGPGHDAFSTGTYSRFDLLDVDGPDPRWPLLETEALTALAPVVIHALPMGPRGERVIGVLTLYQGGVDREIDLDSALVVARVLAAALVADGPTATEAGQGPWAERAEVHQATGMVVAQLGIPEDDALALLRAHAYSHDQSVGQSAHAVVSRALTFSATPDREIETT
jgi:hypothetical protein